MKLLIIFFISSLSLNSYSKQDHIFPNSAKLGEPYVEIVNYYGYISFKKCFYGLEKNLCNQIGDQKFYSEEKLLSQFKNERVEELLSYVYLFGTSAVGFITFGSGYLTITGTTSIIVGLIGAFVSTKIANNLIDGLDVQTQGLQVMVLDPKVLRGENLYVGNINEVIAQLKIVLKKLE